MKISPDSQSNPGIFETGDIASMLNESSIDAIIGISSDHKIIAWNNAAALISGKKKEDVLGRSIFEVISSMSDDAETLQAIKLAEQGIKSFLPASSLYMHRNQVENHFIPLMDIEGVFRGVMNLVHDVAHRIEAERRLQVTNEELQQRIRHLRIMSDELSNFTSITSNKIKEPIRNVYTAIEHMIKIEANRLSDTGKAAFRRIQSSVSKIDLLIDDMLKLSQVTIIETAYTEVDIKSIVEDLRESLQKRAERRVNITFNIECLLYGNEKYIRILLTNLLDNAVKFNQSPIIAVQIATNDIIVDSIEYCRLTVTDNGIGFKEEDANKIFEMYERLSPREYRGSGIGLTIARKVLEVHDGFIEADGSPMHGASFHCYFPIRPAAEDAL